MSCAPPHAHALIPLGSNVTAAKSCARGVLGGADRGGLGGIGLGATCPRRAGSGCATARHRSGRGFPALVRGPGALGRRITSPFVVALTKDQAADAGRVGLRSITSRCRRSSRPLTAVEPGAPLVWEGSPSNVAFFHPEGGRGRATDAAFADARTSSSAGFVINRVTAAAMEPARRDRRLQPRRGPLDDLHDPAGAPHGLPLPNWRGRWLKVPRKAAVPASSPAISAAALAWKSANLQRGWHW